MKGNPQYAITLLPLILALSSATALADVELPSVFSDHMVLQRDRPTKVWGRADAGEQVTVQFADETQHAKAGADGRWSVALSARPANAQGHDLVVSATNQIVLHDVLVGEVWLCTGQSNMEWSVASSNDAEKEIAAAKFPRIRLFKASHTLSHDPQFTVPGSWAVCDPSSVGNFSAVGYFFARDLLHKLDVPIGLISTNWGGTRAEPWTSPDALASHSLYREDMESQREALDLLRNADTKELEAIHRAELERVAVQGASYWKKVTAKDPGTNGGWSAPDFDDAAWSRMQLPALWEGADKKLADLDGLVWFRRRVEIPANWAGKDLQLELGMIDDSDVTYFNGALVGSLLGQHQSVRSYAVPAALVKAGSCVISVLVYDTGGAGGFNGPKERMRIGLKGDKASNMTSLAGSWSWRVGGPPQAASLPKPAKNPGQADINSRTPGAMYNAMIHPFVPYGLRGAIWYQGESNAGQAAEYRELLPLMISSWREAFGQGDFPFGVVQLASFMAVAPEQPVQGGWAFLRDAQSHTARSMPNVGLVVASDIGAAKDIHPRNKQAVGHRMALWALATIYGHTKVEYSGPIYSRFEQRGHELVVHYHHGKGLKTTDGEGPAGFAIADESGKFVWASARINGDTVVLSAREIKVPSVVRYGWCNNLEHLNLVNAADLPASPFRSDAPE
ncbi:MAG: 9-O-acetylesterase [Planctomycetota bacterium]|nr:9-O-acetylesterase [Planctomycetota bacterium]